MKIFWFSGIATPEILQTYALDRLRAALPEATIVPMTKGPYHHGMFDAMRKSIQKAMDGLRETDSVYLIGHSFGGILALCAAHKTQQKKAIKGIITLGTPHELPLWFVPESREELGYPDEHAALPPLITIGGQFDPIVPPMWAHRKNTIKSENWNYEHAGLLLQGSVPERIKDELIPLFP